MTELLTLRRSTRAHELLNSVPKPKGSVPKNGLPDWAVMGLEYKLPLVNAPENAVVFSRGKTGKKVWKKFQDFVLDDPNCHDVSYAYDPLHDKHLRDFFSNERNMKRVKELGLVTETGNAVCSLKSFNEYRRYLKRVHMDLVKKERERREKLDQERRDIEKAKKYAKRDAEICARREQKKAKMAGVIAKLQREEQLKKDDIERRIERRIRQQKLVERKREMEKEERKAKGEAFDRRIRDRIEAAANFQRRKIVSTLRQWNEGEADLRRRRLRKRRERKSLKEEKDRRKWRERMEYQLNRVKHVRELLEEEANEFAYRVKLRNAKVEKERRRMDDLFQRIKEQRGRKQCHEQKRKQSQLLAKIVHKSLLKQIPNASKTLNKKTVEETLIKSMLALDSDVPNNDSIVDLLEEVKIRLAEKIYLPPEVTDIMDEILDNAMRHFVWKKVDQLVNDIISRGIQTIKKINSKGSFNSLTNSNTQISLTNGRHSSNEFRRRTTTKELQKNPEDEMKRDRRYSSQELTLSQLSYKKSKSNTSHRHSSVCFGKVLEIGVTAQEIETEKLKSVKERPPTPAPSLSDLATAVFDDSIALNDIEKTKMLTRSNSFMSMAGREELIRQLKYLKQEIGHIVYIQLEKELKSYKERKYHSLAVTQEDIVSSMVNGIETQGTDYSLNVDELEWVSRGIIGIISYNIWRKLIQGQEKHKSTCEPVPKPNKSSLNKGI